MPTLDQSKSSSRLVKYCYTQESTLLCDKPTEWNYSCFCKYHGKMNIGLLFGNIAPRNIYN